MPVVPARSNNNNMPPLNVYLNVNLNNINDVPGGINAGAGVPGPSNTSDLASADSKADEGTGQGSYAAVQPAAGAVIQNSLNAPQTGNSFDRRI